MKKIFLLLILIFSYLGIYAQNDSIYFWKSGVLLEMRSIKSVDLDSITFKRPTPPALETYDLITTTTVEAIVASANATPTIFTTDDIIEAYVTSSDESNNFFKSISFQTIPTDGSAPTGFSVFLDEATLYSKGFTPGRKIYIKLNGLYRAMVSGSLQIGSLFEGSIGRITALEWRDHLFPSATIVDENTFVRTLSLADAFADANQNTLIDLDSVQFSDISINNTYGDVSAGGVTSHFLFSSSGGLGQVILFSNFCSFASNQVPTGSGKIRGVLTKFNTTLQFRVRYESDIQLTQPRFDVNPPIGGTFIQYNGVLNEPFTDFPTSGPSSYTFPSYINDAAIGARYWQVRTFGGNKYLQFSSFGGTPESNRALFILPVNMTAANTMSFKTKSGFDNGSPLKVYYSTNYIPFSNIDNATLVDITSNFSIPNGFPSSYPVEFSPSGNYSIPASLTGNGFFIFEYQGNGNGGIVTTMQIDDIVIN
jgi:hypothetical protein